jgi:hypothetical protein
MAEYPSEQGMEVHPVVQLIIARMESNPQEFYRYRPGQTGTAANNTVLTPVVTQTLEHTKALWNRKEKRLYNMALRKVRMQEAHERLMAVLLGVQ